MNKENWKGESCNLYHILSDVFNNIFDLYSILTSSTSWSVYNQKWEVWHQTTVIRKKKEAFLGDQNH